MRTAADAPQIGTRNHQISSFLVRRPQQGHHVRARCSHVPSHRPSETAVCTDVSYCFPHPKCYTMSLILQLPMPFHDIGGAKGS